MKEYRPSFMDLPDPPAPLRDKNKSLAVTRTVYVILPDGSRAQTRTRRPVRFAVAARYTNDPILGDHWTVHSWLTRSTAIPNAIANANKAGAVETRSLDVIDDRS